MMWSARLRIAKAHCGSRDREPGWTGCQECTSGPRGPLRRACRTTPRGQQFAITAGGCGLAQERESEFGTSHLIAGTESLWGMARERPVRFSWLEAERFGD